MLYVLINVCYLLCSHLNLKEDEIQLPVFLMVRREKLTIFLEAFENTKVIDILIMLQCIVKKAAEDMRLMKENQVYNSN
jgi:hypothetical protein